MPVVRITMAEGRSRDEKEALAEEVTAALVKHVRAHREHVYVIFEDIPAEDWTVGGETIKSRREKRGERWPTKS